MKYEEKITTRYEMELKDEQRKYAGCVTCFERKTFNLFKHAEEMYNLLAILKDRVGRVGDDYRSDAKKLLKKIDNLES